MSWETVALLLGTVVMVLEHLRESREGRSIEQRLVRLETQVEALERSEHECPGRSGRSRGACGEE